MILNKENIEVINSTAIQKPSADYFNLPEKVLQFGTGVLLRGLPDFYIDKANKQNIFNGRIVVVKSTASAGADAFEQQDGLYTHVIKGIDNGTDVEQHIINASISRVLSAKTQWADVLACAANPELQVIISNTTEVGISLMQDDDVHAAPPQSFPGKLLAFLYERYTIFNGDTTKGFVIIPTELIVDNGNKLEAIVEELAHINKMDFAFIDWLENANSFCNSLVDRIVPGKMPEAKQQQTEAELGFTDELMIMSEAYSLWAIESANEQVKQILSFAKADEGVVIADDINKFRELKLRLLNGSHTFTCGLAHLAGFETVKEAMADKHFYNFINDLMIQEIVPAISSDIITVEEAEAFAAKVLDRYKNPYLDHKWLAITMQYSSKMQMRNVPAIQAYYKKFASVPQHMALGFAAFILFMKTNNSNAVNFYGEANGNAYTINDDKAQYFNKQWQAHNGNNLVHAILGDEALWNSDLSKLPGFENAVAYYLESLINKGAVALLQKNTAVEVAA